MKTFLASVAVTALMGGSAMAQGIVLVPQGQGPMGQQQFILVPVPQDGMASPGQPAQQGQAQQGQSAQQGGSGQQGDGQQAIRERAEAMALDLYRRGYQRGMADAASQSPAQLDPAAMEQIGRELFERGYMLGLMQARAQMTAQQMPTAASESGTQAATGQQPSGQQQTGGSSSGAAEQGDGQTAAAGSAGLVTPEQIAQVAQQTPTAGTQGGGSDGQTAATETNAGQFPQALIRTQPSEQYGRYLTDANGRAVYMLEADQQGQGDTKAQSNCHDQCAAAWPPVLTQGTPPRAGENVQEDMLSTIERQDGTTQVTYNGWPLYYYVKDEGEGTATGQDVHDEWGEWYLLQPNGEAVGH